MQDLLPWMAPWGVWSLYLLMFIAGCTLAAQGWFARRLHDHPRCPKCGYDRTGLPSATCPECGYCVTRQWEPYTSRRRRHSLLLLGLLTAVALPSVAVTRRVRQYGWEYYRRVGPAYWMFPTNTVWAYRNGEYAVSCLSDPAECRANSAFSGEKLVIERAGHVVLALEDAGDSVHLEQEPPSGTDLNGNSVPDLVIRFDSHGSGAYQDYKIFELGASGLVLLGEFGTKGEGTSGRLPRY